MSSSGRRWWARLRRRSRRHGLRRARDGERALRHRSQGAPDVDRAAAGDGLADVAFSFVDEEAPNDGLPGIGVRLTTIWPGRPGKARWAAVAGDGSRVAVFEGADLRTSIAPPEGVVRGFGRGLR